jgi:hypothetical protein
MAWFSLAGFGLQVTILFPQGHILPGRLACDNQEQAGREAGLI